MILSRHCLRSAIVLSVALLATPAAADVDIQRYFIQPGGQYTYLASPEGPGVPGCSPSDLECAFGIEGNFSIHFDRMARTAEFLDLDLALIGNEDIQNNPPAFALVTADRVATFLEDRFFEDLGVLGPYDGYADTTFPQLIISDFFGTLELRGGYDMTFIDGDGLNFDVVARPVPEPSSIAIGGCALVMGLFVRRRSMRRLTD